MRPGERSSEERQKNVDKSDGHKEGIKERTECLSHRSSFEGDLEELLMIRLCKCLRKGPTSPVPQIPK